MTHGKRTLQILGSTAAVCLAASVAQAGTLVTNSNPFAGSDTLNFATAPTGTCLGQLGPCSPLTASLPSIGTPDTVSFLTGYENFVVWAAALSTGGTNFDGNFSIPTTLISTNGQSSSIEFSFSAGISAFGVYVQDYNFGSDAFSINIQTNDAGTCGSPGCSESSTTYYPSSGFGSSDSPLFIGVETTTGTFTAVTITTTSNSGINNDFVLGDVSYDVGASNSTPPAVPEPSTIVMMAGGLAALAWKARKLVRS